MSLEAESKFYNSAYICKNTSTTKFPYIDLTSHEVLLNSSIEFAREHISRIDIFLCITFISKLHKDPSRCKGMNMQWGFNSSKNNYSKHSIVIASRSSDLHRWELLINIIHSKFLKISISMINIKQDVRGIYKCLIHPCSYISRIMMMRNIWFIID